ncbi:MAG TPA: GMC family oxidoreductase [Longimicrobiaceae bacterium]|nr:GMC family oxidoreductase [Longimicrobiaceae bacterium]
MSAPSATAYDTLIVGSGFGGVLCAHALVSAGQRVLMIERGGWLERSGAVDPLWDFFQLGPAFDTRAPHRVEHDGRTASEGVLSCVGGASIVYGGVSFRLRAEDFEARPEIVEGSGASWPIGYADLEPFYTRAEGLLNVAGEAGRDPTEPARSAPYPRPPGPPAPISVRIADAARRLGLHPFRIPTALDESCVECTSCDGYASAGLGRLLREPPLASGLELRTHTAVTRLNAAGGRVTGVECVDRRDGARSSIAADRVVVAAGALATPQLLLASGLDRLNPGGRVVGRYLMRHCNAFVYGVFPGLPEPGRHHKEMAVNDFYRVSGGDGTVRTLGNIQQVMHPQLGGILRRPARSLRRAGLAGRTTARALARGLAPIARRMTGLQVIAEDEPQASNRVEIQTGPADPDGLPRLRIVHDYTRRDLAARAELIRHARSILREAGALPWIYEYPVSTFSHAVGTVRMGADPRTSALDEHCRFRGVEGLFVVDGSFMPTSGGVNPSLTIAANALRVGEAMAR